MVGIVESSPHMDFLLADAHARQRGENLDGSPRRETIVTGPRNVPVTQSWTHGLTFMQQAVLMGAVRGPDGTRKFHKCKPMFRWYRRCTLICALDGSAFSDPFTPGGGSFTGPVSHVTYNLNHYIANWPDYITCFVDDYLEARDEIPHHIQMHAMHAFEIVGYKHPDERIREFWHDLYVRIVRAMHCYPETHEQLDERLGDTLEGWRKHSDYSETRGCTVTCSD